MLLNDWSARDIQAWEYVPLGPFLSKNFCTTISPWVVTLEALEPFRTAGPAQEPTPLPYLRTDGPQTYDIHLEVYLRGEKMDAAAPDLRDQLQDPCTGASPSRSPITPSTAATCEPATCSAPARSAARRRDSYGSLLELTWRGARPLSLPDGARRTFLEDGDRVTLTGWCQGDGYRVGFGEATGRVLPALSAGEGLP